MEMLVTQWGWRLGPGHEFHHISEYSNLTGDMSIFKNRNIKGYKGNPGLAGPAGAPRNPRNIFLRLKMLFLHRKHGFRTGMTHTEEKFPGPQKIFFEPGPPPGPPSGPARPGPPGGPEHLLGGCSTRSGLHFQFEKTYLFRGGQNWAAPELNYGVEKFFRGCRPCSHEPRNFENVISRA